MYILLSCRSFGNAGTSSTNPEERQFVIDSGASMHMLSKKDLRSGELETLKRSRFTITVVTANGEVQTNEEAQLYVHDLHIFVTAQLLEDTSVYCPLANTLQSARLHVWVAQWSWATSDQKWETDLQRTENFVHLAVPGLSSRSTTASSSTSSPQDLSVSLDPANVRSNEGSTGNCSKELRGTATGMVFPSCWRTSQRTSRSQKYQHPLKFLMTQIRNVPQKRHHGSTVFKLISQKTENQNDKGSLQNANWRSSTSSRKVSWLDNGGSHSPQRGGWISRQSPVQSRGSRSCHSMDSILSVQNGNFSGNGKEFTEISRAVTKAKSYLHWQFVGIHQILWRFIMESSYFHTSLIRDECYCRKSSAQNKGRIFSSIVAIWLGWKSGGLILWNAVAICEMPRTSWQTGKLHMKGDSENHFKAQWFILE